MDQTPAPLNFSLVISNDNVLYLSEASKWAKFLAILGFIFCGLFVVIAFFAGPYLFESFNQMAPAASATGGLVITTIYILIAILYFSPCLYLFKFASKMQTA